MEKWMKKNLLLLSLSLLVIGLDQLTKLWAHHSLAFYHSKPLLPFFSLTLAYNTGASFSFLANASGWQNLFFIAVALVVSVVLVVWLYKLKDNMLEALAISLVLGGAWGNVIDRLHLGKVIDFLHLHWGSYSWPIFNLADTAICIGAVLLLISAFRGQKA